MNYGLTLLDVVRKQDPNSPLVPMVEIMNKVNPILDMLPFCECNNGMLNITPIRTSLPKGSWRRLYGGVPVEKATSSTVTDACGMLESYSKVDVDVADKAPNKARLFLDEDRAFIEGMSQTMATTFIYGDSRKAKDTFTGIAPRYSAYGADTEHDDQKLEYYILNGGSTTDNVNTSIFLVSHDDTKLCGLYPKGSSAGLKSEDLGKKLVKDDNGNDFLAYVNHYKWDCGFAIKNFKNIVRICNIDTTQLASAGDAGYAGANILKLLITASHRIEGNAKNLCFYAGRDVIAALDNLAVVKANLALGWGEFAGQKFTTVRGIPVKQLDAISMSEKLVPAA